MFINQELTKAINEVIDFWSDKFLNRLINILTGIQNEKIKNDQNLTIQFSKFLKSKESKIILIDAISKQEITSINSYFTPVISSIIAVARINIHICDVSCYEDNYACQQKLLQLFETYQVVDHPTFKNNSVAEVFVKLI